MEIVSLLRYDYLVISMFVGIVGGVIKYRCPKIHNKIIPLILFALSFLICATWGYFSSEYYGATRIVEAILMHGLVHGLITTAIANQVWSSVHGGYVVWKSRRKDNGEKENV